MELESISYLLKSLRDPMGTPCCAKVLYLGSGMLTPYEPDLMAKDELACDRSEQDTCRCDLHNPAVAHLHLGDTLVPSPPDLDNALTLMCTILSEGLSTLHVGKFRKVWKNTTADKQPWPNSEDEVLQSSNSAKGPVDNLLRWAAALPNGYAIFMVIGAIARFWEPFAREILRTPRTFSLATDNMQIALDCYDANMPPSAFSKKFYLPLVSCARQPKASKYGLTRCSSPWRKQVRSLRRTGAAGIPDVNFSKGAGSHLLRQLIYLRNLNQCMNLECTEALGIKTMALSDSCVLNKTEWAKWMVQTMDKDELTPARREPLFETLCRSKKVGAELTLSIENGASALKEAKRAQLDELERNCQKTWSLFCILFVLPSGAWDSIRIRLELQLRDLCRAHKELGPFGRRVAGEVGSNEAASPLPVTRGPGFGLLK
ncbi:hypothetical protein DFH07DRAFT_769986 [Mycena maculata]|uniref:Uncharacterized protein n=1 Tax=Mycena maculata TaxID=230809 RepID=A0AAD7JMY8_9AGAR|nr:hypothetical protein DFH07DRAFT_769986 [Mycena maculata]